MPEAPIRRAQLVTPSGVGSLIVARSGISLICCGLDHWYEKEDGSIVDIEEFRIQEWRLEQQLGVSHLRLPPDFREAWKFDAIDAKVNLGLTVPFLRFPQWHHCTFCYRLEYVPLIRRGPVHCSECLKKTQKKRRMEQVRFIAVCDKGHIQDFPWTEWVHKSGKAQCHGTLRLKALGAGATLASQTIECACGAHRTLSDAVFGGDGKETTGLSSNLEKGEIYSCQGERPWLGYERGEEPEDCDRPLHLSLRNAINVYYPVIRSSIFIPRSSQNAPEALVTILENPPFSTYFALLKEDDPALITPARLRKRQTKFMEPYTDDQIAAAISIILKPKDTTVRHRVAADSEAVAFRREEFDILREPREETDLRIRKANLAEYAPQASDYLQRLTLLDKLRETSAFLGFNRIRDATRPPSECQKWLWRTQNDEMNSQWLPAFVVRGEGLYLEINEAKLAAWESRPDVKERVRSLCIRYLEFRTERGFEERSIGARFIMLHTLSHLLINRLTYECGYSSSALRERLFVSENSAYPMAGLLIYTASGDADGTMGGLVRMGKSGYLEPIVRRAIEAASWCSSDPICMEMAEHGGQGPDSCNLAACHSCALLPETACEEFNRLLDRGLIIGSLANPELGFFRSMLS